MVCESSSRTMVLPAAVSTVDRQRRKSCRCRMSSVRRAACLLAAGTCLLQVVSMLAKPAYAEQHQQSNQHPQQLHLSSQHRSPLALAKVTSQSLDNHHHQQQIDNQQSQQLNSISQTASNGGALAAGSVAASDILSSQLLNGNAQLASMGDLSSIGSTSTAVTARSRSPRSIGEMFKKIFNGNKRSKNSGAQGSREWDQQQSASQQHQQQQQLQQQQQNQAANMASMMAAAANQHAVYASPFATYSPQSSASAFYPQFSPYSSAGLVAWPTASALTHSIRAPTLIGPPSSAVSPLYAAASQSYNSYTAPPSAAAGQPQAAASHQHVSAVPAPSNLVASAHPGSSGPSSLDFHQVLDALVRTSGFAPAGDQEAAAASGYGAKTDGTPVFSFKKLVSLPFYLSTEEKSLDGLANAVGPAGGAGGYSLHSMPIMRRHVRRMSSPNQPPAAGSSQQQQFTNQLAALQAATDKSEQMQRSERAQQEKYSNYLNAINNQIASLTANNQLLQYLSARQPQQQQQQSADAYATETAIANYQALLSAANAGLAGPLGQKSVVASAAAVNPQTSAAATARQPASSASAASQMVAAASMVQPIAIQAPQSLIQQHQKQQQLEQDRDFANLLNSFQQQQQYPPSSVDPYASAFTNNQQIHSYSSQDGHRLGQANQQTAASYPQLQNYYGQLPQTDSFLTAGYNNGNNNGQEAYLTNAQTVQASNSAPQQQVQSQQQNNAMNNHHAHHSHSHHSHNHHQHEQQQNHQLTPGSSSSAAQSTASDVVVGSPSSAVAGQQQQSQQIALGAAGSQQSQVSGGNPGSSQQIDGQQQQQK